MPHFDKAKERTHYYLLCADSDVLWAAEKGKHVIALAHIKMHTFLLFLFLESDRTQPHKLQKAKSLRLGA